MYWHVSQSKVWQVKAAALTEAPVQTGILVLLTDMKPCFAFTAVSLL